MVSPAERFVRSERLRRSKDFQRVARQGSRVASSHFVLLACGPEGQPGREGVPGRRLGVTASRKVGPAVTRNRVKRGIREWFRHHRGLLSPDVDLVVIARPSAARLTGPQITEKLSELARRLRKRSDGPLRKSRPSSG